MSIDGLLLIGLFLTVLIIALKKYLKEHLETSTLKLTLLGSAICFVAELVFQAVRQPFLNAVGFNEHLYYYLLGTFVVSIMGTAFSFFIAFQLKKKKTNQLILLIIAFVIIVNIIKNIFPSLA